MSDYLKTQIKDLENKISEAKRLLEDPLMSELAKEEIKQLEVQKLTLEKIINTPRSQSGTQNPSSIILEIRAAAGGDEAGLFASDLYRMYTKYAATKKWKIEELDKNEGGLGNIKEVVAKIEIRIRRPQGPKSSRNRIRRKNPYLNRNSRRFTGSSADPG